MVISELDRLELVDTVRVRLIHSLPDEAVGVLNRSREAGGRTIDDVARDVVASVMRVLETMRDGDKKVDAVISARELGEVELPLARVKGILSDYFSCWAEDNFSKRDPLTIMRELFQAMETAAKKKAQGR